MNLYGNQIGVFNLKLAHLNMKAFGADRRREIIAILIDNVSEFEQ